MRLLFSTLFIGLNLLSSIAWTQAVYKEKLTLGGASDSECKVLSGRFAEALTSLKLQVIDSRQSVQSNNCIFEFSYYGSRVDFFNTDYLAFSNTAACLEKQDFFQKRFQALYSVNPLFWSCTANTLRFIHYQPVFPKFREIAVNTSRYKESEYPGFKSFIVNSMEQIGVKDVVVNDDGKGNSMAYGLSPIQSNPTLHISWITQLLWNLSPQQTDFVLFNEKGDAALNAQEVELKNFVEVTFGQHFFLAPIKDTPIQISYRVVRFDMTPSTSLIAKVNWSTEYLDSIGPCTEYAKKIRGFYESQLKRNVGLTFCASQESKVFVAWTK